MRVMDASFTIELMRWDEALPFARPVREAVFIREQGVSRELERDDLDAASDHAVAFDSERSSIGTGRLLPQGRIGRMAVLKSWRRRGVGEALLRRLIERAGERGMPALTLHAQTHAASFYRRFGFAVTGEPFVEAGIPHVAMSMELIAKTR